MNEIVGMLVDSIDRLLDLDTVRQANAESELGRRPDRSWDALDRLGIAHMMLAEDNGGAGCGWPDFCEVVIALARGGAPTALVEEIAARALAERFDLPQPDGLMVFAAAKTALKLSGGSVSGTLRQVAWGRHARSVLTIARAGQTIVPVLVETQPGQWRFGQNPALDHYDDCRFDQVAASTGRSQGDPCRIATNVGALMRAAQIAGAGERVLELSMSYAKDRRQFGRPIAGFQAVQQQLAVLAEEICAAGVAVRSAGAALDGESGPAWVAAAKVRTADAARIASSIAHQVHGAIGFTREHHLRYFTRRMIAWRNEFGSAEQWARQLWHELNKHDGALWDAIVQTDALPSGKTI